MVHTGDIPFIRNLCDKAFITTDNLKIPMLMHTGELPYICKVCGKGCFLSFDLKKHTLVYTKHKLRGVFIMYCLSVRNYKLHVRFHK